MSNRCGPAFTLSFLHPRYWLTWLGLGVGFLVNLLPATARHTIGRQIGQLIYKHNNKRHHIVKTNLKTCFPRLDEIELESMTKTHFQWYASALVDYSLFFFAGQQRLGKRLRIDGKQHIDTAIANGENVIIFLAHSVMLEFAPAALSMHYECYGSYKSAKNPVMDWMIARSRCRHVSFAVSRQEGMRKLIKSLQLGRLMIFLPDEDLGIENSVFAPFFNIPKATLTTPARLAKLGKATCLPAFAWYDASTNQYALQVGEPLSNEQTTYPVKDATINASLLNEQLEALIKAHPEQYMWMLRLFKTRPENQKNIY